MGGTWTAEVWQSSGATWTKAANPRIGDYNSAVIIKAYKASSPGGWQCFDINPSDHEAKCTGSDAKCEAAFKGKAASVQIAANCPADCAFTTAPAPAKQSLIHEGVRKQPGYSKYMSGCCRGKDAQGNAVKIEGKYSKTAGKSGGIATQEECAAACNAESACLGYCHGTPWCVVYGKGIHLTAKSPWAGDDHVNVGPILTTKPNPTYICGVRGAPKKKSESSKSESSSAAARQLDTCSGLALAMFFCMQLLVKNS